MPKALIESLTLATDDDRARILFVMEMDKMKSIYRQTYLLDQSRRETDAEHSWHLAMLALSFSNHRPEGSDLLKIIKMCLIHDIVEIDAGDTFAFDKKGYEDKAERETLAADRLFNLLPSPEADRLRALWDEFELGDSAEAKFAVALDRLQPLLSHVATEGASWVSHGVHLDDVLVRLSPIREMLPSLWPVVEDILRIAEEEHILLKVDQ